MTHTANYKYLEHSCIEGSVQPSQTPQDIGDARCIQHLASVGERIQWGNGTTCLDDRGEEVRCQLFPMSESPNTQKWDDAVQEPALRRGEFVREHRISLYLACNSRCHLGCPSAILSGVSIKGGSMSFPLPKERQIPVRINSCISCHITPSLLMLTTAWPPNPCPKKSPCHWTDLGSLGSKRPSTYPFRGRQCS